LRQNLAVRYPSAFAAGREASTAKVKMMTTAKEDFWTKKWVFGDDRSWSIFERMPCSSWL